MAMPVGRANNKSMATAKPFVIEGFYSNEICFLHIANRPNKTSTSVFGDGRFSTRAVDASLG